MTPPVTQRQYEAWGVTYQNEQISSVHIANGLLQLLRSPARLPDRDDIAQIRTEGDNFPQAYVASVRKQLGEQGKLSKAATSFSVTKYKGEDLYLADPISEKIKPSVRNIVNAGKEHAEGLLQDGVLGQARHRIISTVLNADGKVWADGGRDPTTPGFILVGDTSPYSLDSMHAATFLGMLAASGDEGCSVLKKLHEKAATSYDPHSRFVELLQLGDDLREGDPVADWSDQYPLPPDSTLTKSGYWNHKAKRTTEVTKRLIAWSNEGKAELLMCLIDLLGLCFTTDGLLWNPPNGEDEEGHSGLLPIFSPATLRTSDNGLLNMARRSLQRAKIRLEDEAREKNLRIRRSSQNATVLFYNPTRGLLNLGAATGWLLPRTAKGKSMRYFSPGPRQLRTLVHSVIELNESVSWVVFDRRVREHFGLTLGGADELEVQKQILINVGTTSLKKLGKLNQEHLIGLGLARKESDNVVIVDGGLDV